MAAGEPSSSGSGGSNAAWSVKLPGWNSAQVQRAAESLLKFVGKQKSMANDLFDDDETLYLVVALKKMPLQSRKDKPVPLPIPHALYTADNAEVCLFVKDHDGTGGKQVKKRLEKFEKNGGVAKVIGVSKLRTKYESHEAKRQLCKAYDLFLADDRVVTALPNLIGKSFFKKKKQPIPIKLSNKDLPAQIKKACQATYMFKHSGTCVNVRVARSTFTPKQVEENVRAALAQAVEHIPKKWSNVQAVFLKTADSVALPLFQTLPDQAAKIGTEVAAAAEAAPAAAAAAAEPAKAAAAAGKKGAAAPAPAAEGAKAKAPAKAAGGAAAKKPAAASTAAKAAPKAKAAAAAAPKGKKPLGAKR